LDFPHLMLRYRAIEHKKGKTSKIDEQLKETDRNGKLAGLAPSISNWASSRKNGLTRPIMQSVLDIHKDAELPQYANKTFAKQAKANPPSVNKAAPAHKRKAVLYATCFANYNDPEIGLAAQSVLALNGVETEIVYPECCGMPQIEHGDISRVAQKAKNVSAALKPYINDGYDVIALVPSCALMLKFEWPLILPDDEDVKLLSQASFDISEYVVNIAKNEGLAEGLKPLDGGVSVHISCHARAQNMGQKAAEMMKLIPDISLKVVERCSGHGGAWGVKVENFETALKVGRPVYRQMANNGESRYIVSECPLAGVHIAQGMEQSNTSQDTPTIPHPIVLLARSY
ncbi:MAG: heterodisulfide reductase-related iron-sulfur binding cluster, partial [Alphaproteobacteria bacterium]|nr:heterodisulfide reductase-related iron-sulfur binding cluster [Alphaproteobacteria bacterium]